MTILTLSRRYTRLSGVMPENLNHKRLIELPKKLWAALDVDAEACRRSSQKQLEAILIKYYGLDDVELGDVTAIRESVSPYSARPGTLAFDRKMKHLLGGDSNEAPKTKKKTK